jgi:hypothetical protein
MQKLSGTKLSETYLTLKANVTQLKDLDTPIPLDITDLKMQQELESIQTIENEDLNFITHINKM